MSTYYRLGPGAACPEVVGPWEMEHAGVCQEDCEPLALSSSLLLPGLG